MGESVSRGRCLAALLGVLVCGAFAAETKTDPKPAPIEVEMGPPQILSWVPPVFPKEAIDQKFDGWPAVDARPVGGHRGRLPSFP